MIGCVENIKLEALAATVSKSRVPVEERCAHLISAKQAKRLTKGTGFEKLSITENEICTSDLCFNSVEKIIRGGVLIHPKLVQLYFFLKLRIINLRQQLIICKKD